MSFYSPCFALNFIDSSIVECMQCMLLIREIHSNSNANFLYNQPNEIDKKPLYGWRWKHREKIQNPHWNEWKWTRTEKNAFRKKRNQKKKNDRTTTPKLNLFTGQRSHTFPFVKQIFDMNFCARMLTQQSPNFQFRLWSHSSSSFFGCSFSHDDCAVLRLSQAYK